VIALLYCKNKHSGNSRSSAPASVRLSGYRAAQHLMGLAHKFNRPVVVFTTSRTSLQGSCIAEPHEALGFSNHILAQCRLEVPIILAVLSRWSSGDIFGAWLPDKILTLEQTRFSMTILDQEKCIRVQVGAKYLLHQGIIDQTVPVTSGRMYDSQVTMPKPKRLRAALSKLLEEVSHVPPKELMIRRKEKIERISEIASRTFGPEKAGLAERVNGFKTPGCMKLLSGPSHAARDRI
jgi:acetyl-CoA carboxylase alpha subunit